MLRQMLLACCMIELPCQLNTYKHNVSFLKLKSLNATRNGNFQNVGLLDTTGVASDGTSVDECWTSVAGDK